MTSTNGKSRLRRIWIVFLSVMAGLGYMLRNTLALFAESADTTSDNATSDSVRGGVLNYRTGKLDDGTDATGWYEKD
jgi:hypothetical protein